VLTHDTGYARGEVKCVNGTYVTTVGKYTCSGSFTQNVTANHFTAICQGKINQADTCVIQHVSGYSGGTVTCTNGAYVTVAATSIDNCVGHGCLNGGTCVDGLNTYTCNCAAGFNGTKCANANCTGWTDAATTNKFTAVCTSATAEAATCTVTPSTGYTGGSVTCTSGTFIVVKALADCTASSWTDDAATKKFTAVCTAATASGSTCVITHTTGFSAGSVTCTDGTYVAVAGKPDCVPANWTDAQTQIDPLAVAAVQTAVNFLVAASSVHEEAVQSASALTTTNEPHAMSHHLLDTLEVL
jgi:hypothetical protein